MFFLKIPFSPLTGKTPSSLLPPTPWALPPPGRPPPPRPGRAARPPCPPRAWRVGRLSAAHHPRFAPGGARWCGTTTV